MLLEHCPNLRELAIGGACPAPRLFDVRHVIAGRWPHLQSLKLGDVVVRNRGKDKDSWPRAGQEENRDRNSAESAPTAHHGPARMRGANNTNFVLFLLAHPGLCELTLHHAPTSAVAPSLSPFVPRLSSPASFNSSGGGCNCDTSAPVYQWQLNQTHPHPPPIHQLPPPLLPSLTSFTGPLKYIQTLLPHEPALAHNLRRLTLTTLHHSAASFPPTVAVLRELWGLEELGVWVDLSFGGGFGSGGRVGTRAGEACGGEEEGGGEFRMLLGACRKLKGLEIMCYTRPTFHVVRPLFFNYWLLSSDHFSVAL